MSYKIESTIKEILDKANVSYKEVENKRSDLVDSFRYIIKTDEPAILIGNRGETLRALNYLLKKIIEKSEPENKENFIVDVGDYHEKKIQEIRNKAVIFSERAKFFKKDIEMSPMSSYERMIVHTILEQHPGVKTESTGYGKNRRVVIKYLNE